MKHLKIFFASLVTFVFVFAIALSVSQHFAKANPSRYEHNYLPGATFATTTGLTATTTGQQVLTFLTNGADKADMMLNVKASSSTMTLTWTYEYSPNNVDWFGEDIFSNNGSATTTVNHSSTTPTHIWSLASGWFTTASTANKSVLNIPLPGTDYARVKFITTVGTSTVWGDVITKIQEPSF